MSNLREVHRYEYLSADGDLLYWNVRYEPKTFRPMMPDGTARLTVDRVLYMLPQLIEDIKEQRFIHIVEGEKDADRLHAEGFAVTTSGSASSWAATDTTILRNAWGIIILPDNDEAGQQYAEAVAAELAPWTRSVQVIHLPNLPEHGDVSDWLDSDLHGDAAELSALKHTTPKWKPPKPKPRGVRRGGKGVGLPYTLDDLYVLRGFKKGWGQSATAYCPAHHDTGSKGLSMTEKEDGRTLVKCWSGCDYEDIVKAIDKEME